MSRFRSRSWGTLTLHRPSAFWMTSVRVSAHVTPLLYCSHLLSTSPVNDQRGSCAFYPARARFAFYLARARRLFYRRSTRSQCFDRRHVGVPSCEFTFSFHPAIARLRFIQLRHVRVSSNECTFSFHRASKCFCFVVQMHVCNLSSEGKFAVYPAKARWRSLCECT